MHTFDKKRIALITTHPRESGLGRYAFELNKVLRNKCNIDFIYLNFRTKSIEIMNVQGMVKISQLMKIPLIDNKPFFWLRAQNKLPDYDLYHLSNQNISFLVKQGLKIVTCHDLIPVMSPVNRFESGFRNHMYSGLNTSAAIIADSNQTKTDILNRFGVDENLVSVIHLGIDHTVFRKIDVSDKLEVGLSKYTLLHVGTEQKNKNVSTLIKVINILLNKGIDIRLIRVGAQSRAVSELIKELHLESKISYKSKVTEDELVRLYNSADLFVLPSSYEGFGLPVLEAMSCGCPVVTSNTSSLPEVTGDAAISVDPYDVEGIAKAIWTILVDADLRSNLIEKGLQRAGLFSWENTANETLKIYRKVLETRY